MHPAEATARALLAHATSTDEIYAAAVTAAATLHTSADKIADPVLFATVAGYSGARSAVTAFAEAGVATWGDVSIVAGVLAEVDATKGVGAIYTPAAVSRLLVRSAVDGETRHVLDPACGSGALLAAALEQLVDKHGALAASRMLNGYDIDPAALARARVLIALAALECGDNVAVDPRLHTADALFHDWNDDFPHGVDALLANPPYVRFQHIDPIYRQRLVASYASMATGTSNLYYAFIALVDKLLSDTGRFAYITPNNFFTTASAAHVRGSFASSKLIEHIVDFGSSKVFSALTYTAVTAGSRSPARASFTYRTAEAPDDITPSSTVRYETLSSAPWRLVAPESAVEVDVMARSACTLGDVADIRYGFATLRDSLFLLTGDRDSQGMYVARYGGTEYPIEPGATKPAVKVPTIKKEAALRRSRTRVLFPYRSSKGQLTVWDEAYARTKYPCAMAYFDAIRRDLAERDKGVQDTYPAWYAWGRSQGLVAPGPKLVAPLYATQPRFMLDHHRSRLFSNGCSITRKQSAPPALTLQVIQMILQSEPVARWLHATGRSISGGYTALDKRSLAAIPLPTIDQDRATQLVTSAPQERDALVSLWYGIAQQQ